MNIKLFILAILFFLILAKPVLALDIEAKQLEREAKILAEYLAKYDSPLQYHAQDFVDAAKQYNLDWKLVAAISGVESTFGKFIPGGYNAWGWGAYDPYHAVYFSSWIEAIFTVSQGLRENYINRGYTEPYSINRIYAASPNWGFEVTYFMNDIEKFAMEYPAENLDKEINPSTNVAVTSGQLAFE